MCNERLDQLRPCTACAILFYLLCHWVKIFLLFELPIQSFTFSPCWVRELYLWIVRWESLGYYKPFRFNNRLPCRCSALYSQRYSSYSIGLHVHFCSLCCAGSSPGAAPYRSPQALSTWRSFPTLVRSGTDFSPFYELHIHHKGFVLIQFVVTRSVSCWPSFQTGGVSCSVPHGDSRGCHGIIIGRGLLVKQQLLTPWAKQRLNK